MIKIIDELRFWLGHIKCTIIYQITLCYGKKFDKWSELYKKESTKFLDKYREGS